MARPAVLATVRRRRRTSRSARRTSSLRIWSTKHASATAVSSTSGASYSRTSLVCQRSMGSAAFLSSLAMAVFPRCRLATSPVWASLVRCQATRPATSFQFSDNLTISHNHHVLRTGVLYQNIFYPTSTPSASRGSFGFKRYLYLGRQSNGRLDGPGAVPPQSHCNDCHWRHQQRGWREQRQRIELSSHQQPASLVYRHLCAGRLEGHRQVDLEPWPALGVLRRAHGTEWPSGQLSSGTWSQSECRCPIPHPNLTGCKRAAGFPHLTGQRQYRLRADQQRRSWNRSKGELRASSRPGVSGQCPAS